MSNSEANKAVSQDQKEGEGKKPFIPITIDNKPYQAPHSPITGAEIRALPNPDVPADRDLWLEVPGPKDDIKVLPGDSIEIKPGAHFYTAPGTINPGQEA